MRRKIDLGLYVLENGVPVHVKDTLEWAKRFEVNFRRGESRVRFDVVHEFIEVSSVFLGIDHNHARFCGGDHRPILWETMVFYKGGADSDQYRFTERAECLRWHEALVAMLVDKHAPSAKGAKRLVATLFTRLAVKAS